MAKRLDQQFIQSIIPHASFLGMSMPEHASFCVDSRQLAKDDIFVAIKGAHHDGHDYIQDALSKGASGIIMNAEHKELLNSLQPQLLKKLFICLLENVQEDIIALAAAWRAQFTIPVIGITGSVGKTTTKEMLAHILQKNGTSVVFSQQNQNTALGLSLNILRMRAAHEVAVFEMGVSKRGEMARMAELVRPTTAIITAIGHSHMEGLGSLADIANEKRDIFKFFKEENIGIIHGDQPILSTIAYTHPMVKFGFKTTNQVQARKVQTHSSTTHFLLKLYKEKYAVTLTTNHSGRILNALAASAAAYLLNVRPEIIIEGISSTPEIAGRFQPAQLRGSKGIVINDCYNASPESMKAALLAFEKVESKGQKIAVLGDMLELGVNSAFWHRQLGRFLRKVPSLHHVVLVGESVKWTKVTMPVGLSFEHVPDWKAAKETLSKRLESNAVILIKGSQGVGLTHLVNELVDTPS